MPAFATVLLAVSAPVVAATVRPVLPASQQTAYELFASGDYKAAAAAFQLAIESGSATEEAYLYLGISLAQIGNPAGARPFLEKYVSLRPRDPPGWYALGLALFQITEYEGAREAVSRSLELSPNQAPAEKLRGEILVTLMDLSGAERAFLRAVELAPNDFHACFLLGRLYQTIGRLEDARRALARSIELNPAFSLGRAFLGTVTSGLGLHQEAEVLFRQAIAAKTGNPAVDYVPHLEYGLYLQKMGRLEESFSELTQARAMVPANRDVIFESARTLYRLGRLEDARTLLQHVITGGTSEARLHFLLGRVCYELKDPVCGKRETERAESIQGGYVP